MGDFFPPLDSVWRLLSVWGQSWWMDVKMWPIHIPGERVHFPFFDSSSIFLLLNVPPTPSGKILYKRCCINVTCIKQILNTHMGVNALLRGISKVVSVSLTFDTPVSDWATAITAMCKVITKCAAVVMQRLFSPQNATQKTSHKTKIMHQVDFGHWRFKTVLPGMAKGWQEVQLGSL